MNQTARRKPHWEQNWVAPEWAWAWPHNRRMLYNRASADPEGKPWSERKKYVWWDEEKKKWTGYDHPDFIATGRLRTGRPQDARGKDTISGHRSVHHAGRRQRLDLCAQRAAGRSAAHALRAAGIGDSESAVRPAVQSGAHGMDAHRTIRITRPYDDPRFPYVLTTYRLTEHHTAGGMSRWLSWLSELQPEMFCEVSPELAGENGLKNGGWATIRTARAEIEARVLVTRPPPAAAMHGRTCPPDRDCRITGRARAGARRCRQRADLVRGRSQRLDQESKAFTGDIEPGRQARAHPAPRDQLVCRARLDCRAHERSGSAAAATGRSSPNGAHLIQRKQGAKQGDLSLMPGQGLLHRHHALHRLQSLRGGVQAVEPVAGRRPSLHRHVVRQHRRAGRLHLAARGIHRAAGGAFRRRMPVHSPGSCSSDVCKHCARAGCLESCPTGAIIRTEFDTVYVQPDICNGCGYCVVNCPFGVIDRREDDGRAWKCTLCYDRLKDDMKPACAKACPTDSIQFGDLEQLKHDARARVEKLQERA